MDAALAGKSKVRSYRELIEIMLGEGLTPRLFHEYNRNSKDPNVVLLRHDVDRSLDNAMMVARIEQSMGLKATYFMLHPGDYGKTENYYGQLRSNRIVHASGFFDRCHELLAMGHEIGLHNDFPQLSSLTGRSVRDLFAEEIAAFAEAGITIHGSAGHGSKFAITNRLANYEIFAEFVRGEKGRTISGNGWQVTLHGIALNELGLEYEASFVPLNIFFSDSGSQLRIYSQKESIVAANIVSDNDADRVRQVIRDQPDPRVSILAHPCWWEQSSSSQRGGTR